ncbi:F-box protein [Raphanus sativus]|uniref:F-box protein At5g49610-like n=1 Tax=Raphanus sativus TaxID=3726 RepID=A0A9W3CR32_RAPSA|nr:F-box protein At5g49610-like [Raphanus sativus]KAJ4870860.1 F-box protein [Raphanus sativus]
MGNPKDPLFPDEVILQILARLPVKSLFRFKSVSKSWHTLPSDTYFISLFNQLSLKNQTLVAEVPDSSALISVDNLRGVSEFSLEFLRDRVMIRASCNGLLCCASVPEKGVYYVCNPSTREFRTLPRSRERHVTRFYPDGEATLVGLACDVGRKGFYVVMAGYHRSFGHRPDGSFVCLVFDSVSNKWRKFVSALEDDCGGFTHMSKNQVVFVNGRLHWLMSGLCYVLALDLEHDVWRKVSLPDEIRCSGGNRVYLLELDGFLSVIQLSDVWMKIWKMRDYVSEVWCVVDSISLRCIKGLVPGIFPICQTGEYVFLATHKQVLVYQRRSKLWKEMFSVKGSCSLPLWFSAHAFRSTIVPCN